MPAPGQTPQSDSGVAELQRTLKAYAEITGFAGADPGTVDGVVGMKTATAVINVVPRLPSLPSEVRVLFGPVALLALMDSQLREQAFRQIRSNATTISRAIIALEVYRAAQASTAQPGTPVPKSPTTPWRFPAIYTTQLPAAGSQITPANTPTTPALALWFYDGWRKTYRVAVPRQTLNGFANYVEVAPSMSRPTTGTEVNRSAFMSATGQWWASPIGMIAIGAGVVAAGTAAVIGARSILRG